MHRHIAVLPRHTYRHIQECWLSGLPDSLLLQSQRLRASHGTSFLGLEKKRKRENSIKVNFAMTDNTFSHSYKTRIALSTNSFMEVQLRSITVIQVRTCLGLWGLGTEGGVLGRVLGVGFGSGGGIGGWPEGALWQMLSLLRPCPPGHCPSCLGSLAYPSMSHSHYETEKKGFLALVPSSPAGCWPVVTAISGGVRSQDNGL